MKPSASKKVVLAALAGNTAIAITKFAAAAMTGSSSMFSEAQSRADHRRDCQFSPPNVK